MAKKSDFGEEILVTSASGVTYDLNKDYSKAISEAKAAGQDTTQLEAQRQAKIDSKAYGGKYKTGVNESASLGTSYQKGNTVANRTSTADPIVSETQNTPAPQPTVNTSGLTSYLDKWLQSAQLQQSNAIDYATQQGITELQRAEEDAQAQFQTQRNQIAADEAKAKDNQALYAEARGDKGGIGAAQYNSIMNTAAQNRLAVNNAQTKLATDTARQIADLRAQGAYEKADALLDLSQQYLSQLISLEQWGMEYGLNVAQFNANLQQWMKEYEVQLAGITGQFQGAPTLDYLQLMKDIEYKDAGLTGMYQGAPTLDYLQFLQNQQQIAKDNEYRDASLTGFYQGNPTLDYLQFMQNQQQIAKDNEYRDASLTGMYQGNPTLDYLQMQHNQSMDKASLNLNQANKTLSQTNQLASDGLALLKMGIEPSASQLKAMGITKEQAQSYITTLQTQQAVTDSAGVINKMLSFNDDVKAYEYLASQGYTTTVFNQFKDLYEGNKNDPGQTEGTGIRTLEEATAYLKDQGISQNEINEIMTEAKWWNQRLNYEKNGSGSAAVIYYDDYASYLNAYIEYLLAQ